ncbi:MAG: HTH-type transcriptional regulator DsdC [Steroidobacteraceae bacterium]|nr:HTH-type transcriptional regulator DsdC [Steroidobacteraceae bacterium]
MAVDDIDELKAESYRLDAQLISDLWIFRWAARFGSFTGAADRLHVTQGAVSQRMSRLEGRLGTLLFHRTRRGLTLTEAGAEVYQAMNGVAATLNRSLSRFDRVQRRSLVISCLPSLATEWLVPHIDGFYAAHPDVELFIRAELFAASVERMEDEGIDVAICYQTEPVTDLQELAVLDEMIVPVCSRDYLRGMQAADGPPPITRLHDDVPWPGGPREFEWDAWTTRNPEWACRIVSERHYNLAHLAYHAALCGQGVAMGRVVLINRLLGRGELIPATPLAPVRGASYRIVTHRPGAAFSPVRRFASWLYTEMEESQRQTLAAISES